MLNKEIKYQVTESGCHNCTSHASGEDGYPRIQFNNEYMGLHRYIYILHKGQIPEGKLIRHTCDNRKCINPEHLLIGTHSDNINDAKERNRLNPQRGIDNGNVKLTTEKAFAIFYSQESLNTLANKYKISRTQVSDIKNKKRWKHLHSNEQ
jgi:hypothetical protein